MATMEKLVKSLEALKIHQITQPLTDDTSSARRKEKISHCLTIADAMCYSGVRSSSNFLHLLSVSIELLLQQCDDPHSDVRMIADESLNRIIRALADSNVVKIQVELHKEIKKNGSPRTLRAALWRFAELCHMIRPQKGKPYVLNLMPCIIHIARRSEEAVLETLAAAMPKIFKALGTFTTDNDIKGLLKAFLVNLSSTSAVVRRTATSCILTVCLNCRKPHVFVTYILNTLLDCVVPLDDGRPAASVLGVLGCLRNILPHVASADGSEEEGEMRGSFGVRCRRRESPLATDRMLQVYELCLHFTNHSDHNVVNAALETLCQLLQSPPGDLLHVLLAPGGITRSRIRSDGPQEKLTHRTLSQMSVAASLAPGDEASLLDADSDSLPPSLRLPSVEAWVDDVAATDPSPREEDEASLGPPLEEGTSEYSNIRIGSIEDDETESIPSTTAEVGSPVRPASLSVQSSVQSDEVKEEVNLPSPSANATSNNTPFKAVNVGTLTDPDVPLTHCARHIASSFLLTGVPGHTVPDRNVRVSVKALALSCTANILRLHPGVFQMSLDKDDQPGSQPLCDVLLFASHPDPQLRGIAGTVVGSLVQAGLQQAEGNLTDWLASGPVTLCDLVLLLLRGLEDESSVCCRQTLTTVSTCLTELLESVDSRSALPLLAALPQVVNNPYWLVKVKLVEVMSELPYITIHYLTGSADFQEKVLHSVVWTLLGDEDARVRHATATAVVRLVPLLFHPEDHSARDPVTAKAAAYGDRYLSGPLAATAQGPACVDALPPPFDRVDGGWHDAPLEASLSRVVDLLGRQLSTSPSRHLVHGCCQALARLSAAFPTTAHPRGWNHPGLLATVVGLATSSPVTLDLACQLWLVQLASNLLSGLAVASRPPTWSALGGDGELAEHLLVHTVRTLNVLVHVMEETVPTVPASKPVLAAAPALSPARRPRGEGGTALGSFAGLPHYARIHELVKSAYTNYKTSLDSGASEKFVGLLGAVLEALSRLLEVATLGEVGRIADELLAYLRVTVCVEPTTTVLCVQQLLKCLFGTNLGGQWGEEPAPPPPPPPPPAPGFYGQCFRLPYARLQAYVDAPTETRDRDEGSVWMNYLRRKGERKAAKSLRGGADKASLASYIRLFEPMVIKALKQYTVTSDVKLQCRVLLLLSQLVQLRVNYCLLDSDQIFIGFVLKQFEFIEEGQILDAQELIPKIFFFLVHLSYEKHHSKSIISVPKVIQLCDGLMASGQSPITHCIPALVPVVEDVFLVRGVGSSGIDLQELETQREVLVAMLLRLVEYYQVVELLSVVLTEARSQVDGEERWRRWSRQVLDTLLPHLAQGRLRLESRRAQQALQRLFNSAAPSVLRPCDQMLKTLFSESPHLESSLIATERWLGMVLAILLHLISYCKEEVMLARLEELDLTLPPLGSYETQDPLNVAATMQSKTQLPPEEVMARFLMRVIGLIGSHLYNAVFSPVAANSWEYLHEQFSHFLLYCIHIFESGNYCRVAAAAVQLMEGSEDVPTSDLNALFSELAVRCPLVTFQWCYLMTLLGFNDEAFWARILRTQFLILQQDSLEKNSSVPSPCINLEIVRKGGTILYCDYVCENVNDAEVLTWLLVNHIEEVVSLSHESPVQELIAAVHRNSAASGLLVQAIASRCTHLTKPSFVSRLLRCLWLVHPSQSGALLLLLIPRLLGLRQLALARQAGALACRRAELLLTLTHEEVAKQLPQEDLKTLLDMLRNEGLAKKHSGLVSLLNKLGGQCYNMAAIELEPHRVVDPESIRSIRVDEAWFLSQVRQRCCQRDASGMESAQLLSHLSYDDIVSVLASPKISVSTLQECIQLGTQLTLQAQQSRPTSKTGGLESPLYRAGRLTLLNAIQNVRSLLPRPHHVFDPLGREPSARESKFGKRLDRLFADQTFWNGFFEIAPAVSCYMDSLPRLAGGGVPPQEFWQSLAKFGILCLEALSWLILTQPKPKPQCLELGLCCADLILKDGNLSTVIGQASNVSYLGSATSAITRVVLLLMEGEQLPSIQTSALAATLVDPENVSAAHACIQMATLVTWLEETHLKLVNIPAFLGRPIKSLIVSLSRMSLVNSFVATPPDVWRQGWSCDLVGPAKTTVPPLPVEYLQDIDLLQQFIFRVTLLGWTSRQQFEETWMAFLSLLNSNPAENSAPEEVSLVIQASSLAVEAITALLIQTLLLPVPGNPNTGTLIHQPRERALVPSEDSAKLKTVHRLLSWKLNSSPVSSLPLGDVFQRENMERINNPNKYGYSQVSLEYLWTATRILEEGEKEKAIVSGLCLAREESLAATGLDLHSCLHFLLDLYSQWLQPNSGTPLRLLNRAVKSVLAISDLFTEKAQFQWLLSTFVELSRSHPSEDELTHQYLVLGACKAAAVLRPADPDTCERVRKLVESGLRSAFPPARMAGLHGVLYLLQNASDETAHVLPLAVEYIQKHVDGWANQSEEHNLLVWALVFYLMETVEETVVETELSPVVLQLALTLASSNSLPESLHLALLNGLERLIVARAIAGKVSQQVTKLAVERLRHPSPLVCLPGLRLLLTCMYTGEPTRSVTDPEHLIRAMEKTSAMFDRIKRGYPSEVELLCGVLPHILTDFFPPSEVLTKVIGEFLSPQQPHPRQLAAVVFQVFDQACQQSQLLLIQDWVVLSLANFTQCSPIGMASWCITCFFMSASTNPWLRSLFPHVQSRIGRLELEDKKLLYVAAKDFYNQLTDETQKQTFVSTFDNAVQSPFSDLISFL